MASTLDVYDVPTYAVAPEGDLLGLPIFGNSEAPAPRNMPASISHNQLYFWSAKWQSDELVAGTELDRGEARTFASAREAITWLLDPSDDD